MAGFSKKRREQRLAEIYMEEELVTPQKYNMILCGTVLWGIVVNFILCVTVGDVFEYVNPIVFYIGYFACCIIGILMSAKSKNPWISFIGYNLVVIPLGLVISTVVEEFSEYDSGIVTEAFLITMCVTAAMLLFAIQFPSVCSKFGALLLPCLIGVIIAEVIMLLLHKDSTWISWVSAVLFSLYIAYDVYRSQQFACTVDNAVDCAVDIYLDIANLFLEILRILGNGKKRK